MGYIVDSQYELYTPPLNPKEPQLTTADFFEQLVTHAEESVSGASIQMTWYGLKRTKNYGPNVISWQEVDVFIDLKFLDSMLKLDPDLLPCDLAVICKLPCEQVCQPVGPSPIYPHFIC
jgi:hypothetical protein